MPSEFERERQRNFDLALEDVRKEIPASLTDIRQAAIGYSLGQEGVPNTMTMYRFAAFLAVLSRKADEQAAASLTVQREMLRMTKLVLYLSIGLGIVTILQLFK
jgi:hypothetical protein